VANTIIVVNVVSLFVGSRRTPSDRIAGTTVVVVSPRGQLDPASARSSGIRRSRWRLMAALMSPTWLRAWGKLPSRLQLAGSISSASSPRSLAWPD
jgi:hypothetical protein